MNVIIPQMPSEIIKLIETQAATFDKQREAWHQENEFLHKKLSFMEDEYNYVVQKLHYFESLTPYMFFKRWLRMILKRKKQ